LQACHAGSATIHANSAAEAFQRLEDLIAEVAAAAPTRTIQQAVDVVVYIRRTAEGRKVEEIFVPQALRAWETSKAGRAV
jgi:type IV secretion system protein VirB11